MSSGSGSEPYRRQGPSRWVDATVGIDASMAVWPGDPGVEVERVHDIARGDPYTLTRLALGVHTGTHLDAPAHFLAGGVTVDRFPLELAFCRVLVVDAGDAPTITPAALEGARLRRGGCVLCRSSNSGRDRSAAGYFRDFVALDFAAAELMVRRRVRLFGIDGPSVGPATSEGDDIHRMLLDAGIWLLEGLDLTAVGPGRYEMACLPLRLRGVEGSPARVLLRRA